jgi:hypothetical protein
MKRQQFCGLRVTVQLCVWLATRLQQLDVAYFFYPIIWCIGSAAMGWQVAPASGRFEFRVAWGRGQLPKVLPFYLGACQRPLLILAAQELALGALHLAVRLDVE